MKTTVLLFSLIASNLSISFSIYGDRVLEGSTYQQKIYPKTGDRNDFFGISVSLSENRILIGAEGDDDNGKNSGAAYIFEFNGNQWEQVAKLKPSDGESQDGFGSAVSLNGNRALISSPGDDDDATSAGAAYIFDFDGLNWTQTIKLISGEGTDAQNFGRSLSLSNNRALIGAINVFEGGASTGAAFIYDFNGLNWKQTQRIVANDSEAGDGFGISASLRGDRALIGASGANDGKGAAYYFEYDGNFWVQKDKLIPEDDNKFVSMGFSISMQDDYALIGAPYDDDPVQNAGSAYVFKFDGISWHQLTKVRNPNPEVNDVFGWSVSLIKNHILIGAHGQSNSNIETGTAYLYSMIGDNWTQTAKLTSPDLLPNEAVGWSVDLSNDFVAVGASFGRVNNIRSGAAYIFRDEIFNNYFEVIESSEK